jgi:hypothetical protein
VRDLTGTIDGDRVRLRSNLTESTAGYDLNFTFTGKVKGETMSGDLDVGEYLAARWSAKRHRAGAQTRIKVAVDGPHRSDLRRLCKFAAGSRHNLWKPSLGVAVNSHRP